MKWISSQASQELHQLYILDSLYANFTLLTDRQTYIGLLYTARGQGAPITLSETAQPAGLAPSESTQFMGVA